MTTDQVHCTNCGARRARGVAHRCPADNLLALSPATRKVLAAIRAAGGRPLIVGGTVRDALRSRSTHTPAHDVDIEVYGVGRYELIARQLTKIGRVDLTGASFGVLKALVDGEDFDVALPRTETKTGSTHTDFEAVPHAALDEVAAFARRDFTINAMGWDPRSGELVDPYGGTADLAKGVLRHTTDAFREDPLRVLRAVQFAARFDMTLAPETAELAQSIADEYEHLAVERVWHEFEKLAEKGRNISLGLDVLHQTGWERHFPELAAIRDVPQDATWHPEGPVHVHAGLAADRAVELADRDGLEGDARVHAVLAAMLHDLGKAGEGTQVVVDADGRESVQSRGHADLGADAAWEFLKRIRAPKHVSDNILPIIRNHMAAHGSQKGVPSKRAVRLLMRRLDAGPNGPTIQEWARLVDADTGGRGSGSHEGVGAAWLAVAVTLGPDNKPKPPILRGQHLMAAGVTPGPAFAKVIKASVAAQDDGEFDDEAGAIAWMNLVGLGLLEK